MLTTQSLACRYREAFQKDQSQHLKFSNHPHQIPTNQGWQVIIKVAAFKNKKTKRSGWAYEVKTMDGTVILRGGESNGRKSSYQSSQEAVKEANFKSQELGFSKMLILFNTKRLVQICNQRRNPNQLQQTFISDLDHLQLLRARLWEEVIARIERWERKDIGHFKGTTSKQSQNKKRRVTKLIPSLSSLSQNWCLYTITISVTTKCNYL